MLVLGVDPGSRITGYGLVEKKTVTLSSFIPVLSSHTAKSHSTRESIRFSNPWWIS